MSHKHILCSGEHEQDCLVPTLASQSKFWWFFFRFGRTGECTGMVQTTRYNTRIDTDICFYHAGIEGCPKNLGLVLWSPMLRVELGLKVEAHWPISPFLFKVSIKASFFRHLICGMKSAPIFWTLILNYYIHQEVETIKEVVIKFWWSCIRGTHTGDNLQTKNVKNTLVSYLWLNNNLTPQFWANLTHLMWLELLILQRRKMRLK